MKTNPTMRIAALAAAPLILILFSGCGGPEDKDTETSSTAINPAIEAVILESRPEGAVSVINARQEAKPGDEIIVSGKVAGTMKPFTEGFASLVLADEALRTCDLTEDDECETPWDACCADPKEIKASRMTIQILDQTGRPAAQTLKGFQGLKELDSLVVSGTVAEGSSPENLILNVAGLYLEPEG